MGDNHEPDQSDNKLQADSINTVKNIKFNRQVQRFVNRFPILESLLLRPEKTRLYMFFLRDNSFPNDYTIVNHHLNILEGLDIL